LWLRITPRNERDRAPASTKLLEEMERQSFLRPNNDFDVMPIMSDSDLEGEHSVFANAPRVARSMALLAKKRQARKSQDMTRPRNDRKMWEDITTDDEDTFPRWAPVGQACGEKLVGETLPVEEGSASCEGLGWDPIGIGSTNTVAELLWDKSRASQNEASGTVFDKWSWSTSATDGNAEEEETPTSSPSQAEAQISQVFGKDETQVEMAIPPASLPSQASEVAYAMPLAPPAMQMILPFAMAPVAPVTVPPVAPLTQTGAVTPMAPVTSMAPLPSLPMAAMAPGPMPMPINLGMLPVLMSMPQPPNFGALAKSQVPTSQPEGSDNEGPPFGRAHRFHQKNSSMGVLSSDARSFTKKYNKGRLSIICENKVHFQGTVRYAVQFTEGELCSADGVGFILSSDLPCTRNIQKIVSIFVNRTGRICIRVHDEVERCPQRVKCLEIGDWLEVDADLVKQTVSFTVWPEDDSDPSFATVSFKETFRQARGRVGGLPRQPCGFLAVVIKHLGVSVNFGS